MSRCCKVLVCSILLLISGSYQICAEQEVERIEIRAPRPEGPSGPPSTQATVISQEQIKASAARNISEIVAPVLGVQIQRHGGMAEPVFVSIRGSTPQQVLILINGQRLNSAQGGGVDLSSINPEQIERIEIYRGGHTSIFGENAMGGVINIILKEPDTEKTLSGEALLAIGSFQSLRAGLTLQGQSPNNQHRFLAGIGGLFSAGNYRFTDPRGQSQSRDNADATIVDYRISASQQTRAFTVSLTADGASEQRGSPGLIDFPTPEARMEDVRHRAGLQLSAAPGSSTLATSLGYSRHSRRYLDPLSPWGPLEDRHINQNLSLDSRLTSSFEDSPAIRQLRSFYSFRADHLDSTAVLAPESIETTDGSILRFLHSGGISFDIGKAEPQVFCPAFYPSIRIDLARISGDEAGFSPQLSWNLGTTLPLLEAGRLDLKAGVGESHRVPSFNDLFWPATAFAIGNPDLKSESTLGFDLALASRPSDLFRVEAGYYLQLIDNIIHWEPGAGGRWRPSNAGQARIQGLETELALLHEIERIDSFLEINLNANWMLPQNTNPDSVNYGLILPRRAIFAANMICSLNHLNGHHLRLEARYVGRRYITARNTKFIDPYLTIDAGAGWQIKDWWETAVSIRNLLNQSYLDLREFPIPGIEISLQTRMMF